MTVVEISRAKIIKAIKKEPISTLRAGSWYSPGKKNTEDSKITAKSCSVCAVGAVMRNAVLSKSNRLSHIDAAAVSATNDGFSVSDGYDYSLEHGQYMNALSAFFECEAEKWYRSAYCVDRSIDSIRKTNVRYNKFMSGVRKKTIEFVKENFPEKIQIDIDGAKPAKDVKVVSR